MIMKTEMVAERENSGVDMDSLLQDFSEADVRRLIDSPAINVRGLAATTGIDWERLRNYARRRVKSLNQEELKAIQRYMVSLLLDS